MDGEYLLKLLVSRDQRITLVIIYWVAELLPIVAAELGPVSCLIFAVIMIPLSPG